MGYQKDKVVAQHRHHSVKWERLHIILLAA